MSITVQEQGGAGLHFGAMGSFMGSAVLASFGVALLAFKYADPARYHDKIDASGPVEEYLPEGLLVAALIALIAGLVFARRARS